MFSLRRLHVNNPESTPTFDVMPFNFRFDKQTSSLAKSVRINALVHGISVNIGISLCVLCKISLHVQIYMYNAKERLFVCSSDVYHKYVRNQISSNLQVSVRKNLSVNKNMQLDVSYFFFFSSSELILVNRER